ncbi:MAG TPA: glycerophosphoryl diester phosphodiesterase membrane domain-containing protein [Actinomycetota bacterium]
MPSRGLGEILGAAFEIYKTNAAKLLTIVAVVVVPLTFVSAFLAYVVFKGSTTTTTIGDTTITVSDRSFGFFILGTIVTLAISVIISAMLQAAIMRGAAQATLGDPVDVDASYRWGFSKIGSVILISILVGLAVAVGFIFFILPGIFLAVMFAVAIPALVIENRRGTEAMGRSWNLVKGHFWHALVVILVAGLITGIVSGIIGAIGGSNWIVRWIFTAIAQIVVGPFAALVSILLYLDLRARSESLTADQLRGEIATTNR